MSRMSSQTSRVLDVSPSVEHLMDFDGPPEHFFTGMLETQCRLVGAAAGALLRLDEQGRFQIAAGWPSPIDPQKSPPWLAAASRRFNELTSTRGWLVVPLPRADDLYGQQAGEHALIVPMRHQGQLRGGGVYHLTTGDGRAIEFAGRQLAWGAGLLSMYELKLALTQRAAALSQLRAAQEVLAEINSHRRYQSAAMAMCNELAGKFAAHRVSVGFLHGRGVKLATMSHTEKFTRKMRIVQLTEAAMEESLDQDLEVIYPTPDSTSGGGGGGGGGDTSTTVNRAAGELSRQHGPSAIVSLPMRYGGEPFAVLTVEREIEKPWHYAEVAVLRLTCELCTARLVELYERDRWPGARAAKSARKGLAVLVGPRQTWIKLAAVGVIAFTLFLIFAKGTYRVEAPFVIEAVHLRSMPAPFQGYLDQVLVKPGDTVKAGQTLLAKMRTDELELQRNAALAEQRRFQREADIAMRQDKQAERQAAEAQADEAKAKIDLLTYQLSNARIVATIDGVVVKAEYEHRAGSPVDKGAILFEIAPLDALRATLMVPEDRVQELLSPPDARTSTSGGGVKALTGELAPAADPSVRLPIRLQSITPMAEVVDQRNVFRVRALLLDADSQSPAQTLLRPGMEGLAKINIEPRRYAWIWTHDLVNWVRMKLWL
ncbi:MAG: HlyD family efflux transporter periplasmic adaptor subunit [Phycisphaerales bacterium]